MLIMSNLRFLGQVRLVAKETPFIDSHLSALLGAYLKIYM